MTIKERYSWLVFKNYEVFNDLSLEGWRNQILAREALRHDIFLLKNELNNPLLKNYLNEQKITDIRLIIEQLKNNPLLPYEENSNYGSDDTNKLLVKSTTVGEIRKRGTCEFLDEVWNEIKDNQSCDTERAKFIADMPYDVTCLKMRYYLVKEINEKEDKFDGDTIHNLTASELENECLDYFWIEPFANVTVDLTATDEQIEKDFKSWLKNYRNSLKAAGKNNDSAQIKPYIIFNEKTVKSWVDQKLVPYFDIMIVSMFEDENLSYKDLERLIFPGMDIRDKVARTTKPNANHLFSESTLRVLDNLLRNSD
jgi:hypothetical protein